MSGGTHSPEIRVHFLLLLFALFLFALFLGLEPLLLYPVWGSDTGEYYYLTNYLVDHGHLLLSNYAGWGFAYPYFPGMFLLGGAVSEASGTPVLTSLQLVIPILGAFSVFPLFLLLRKVLPGEALPLGAAAIAAVAFPRVFILAHPVPDTLGDLLAVSALWMFVEQRRDMRWLVPLCLTSMALIISHHLSSYFFLLSAGSILAGLELFTPHRWSRRFPLREFVFLGGFTVTMFSYWIAYATPFQRELTDLPVHLSSGIILVLLPSITLVALIFLALLVHLRRTRFANVRSVLRPKWPTTPKMLRDFTLLSLFIFGGALMLVLFPIPGTGQKIPAIDILWFIPLLLLVPLSAGGIGSSAASRLGPTPYPWVIAILCSAIAASVLNIQAIPVERHAEWAVLAMSMIVATGAGAWIGRMEPGSLKRVAAVGAVGLLIAGNAYLALPPPTVTDGFQEGFSLADVSLAGWSATELSPGTTLASDHRLSDLYFGLSGNPATWSNTCLLFLGSSPECGPPQCQKNFSGNVTQAIESELNASLAPSHCRPINAVAVDGTMLTIGVALDPSQFAYPMNTTELRFLEGPQFVLLYQNGPQEVWWFIGP